MMQVLLISIIILASTLLIGTFYPAKPKVGPWTHFAVTYSDGKIIVFSDGKEVLAHNDAKEFTIEVFGRDLQNLSLSADDNFTSFPDNKDFNFGKDGTL